MNLRAKVADALLTLMVLQEAKEYGLVYLITLNPKPEQRIAIQIYDGEKSSEAFKNNLVMENLMKLEILTRELRLLKDL